MTTRPFNLKPHEVRGIIDGRLTQLRRPIKPQPGLYDCGRLGKVILWPGKHPPATQTSDREIWIREGSPFGSVGDLLWGRESWGVGTRPHPAMGWIDGIEYKADVSAMDDPRLSLPMRQIEPPDGISLCDYESKGWRSSTAMPQWASRITVEVLDIRAHRLHDITAAEIQASGTQLHITLDENDPNQGRPLICVSGRYPMLDYLPANNASLDDYYRAEFASQWDQDFAKTAPWPTNPWVFAAIVRRISQ